jgi:acyl-CoA thioester hydrolase
MAPTDRYVAENSFYVRYAETDAMGIVHHASYIVYFEEARSHYARSRGANYAEFEQRGFWLTVSEVHARYRTPARYGQLITARCWIDDLKSRSLAFGYEIVDSETQDVLVTGQTKHICINHQGQVTQLPADWRKMLASSASNSTTNA